MLLSHIIVTIGGFSWGWCMQWRKDELCLEMIPYHFTTFSYDDTYDTGLTSRAVIQWLSAVLNFVSSFS